MLKYANSAKRKRIAQFTSVLALLVMIPALFTFIDVYQENKINNQISAFIKNDVKTADKFQSEMSLDTLFVRRIN